MKYFQCSKCKKLKALDDELFTVVTEKIENIKPENLAEIVCDDRRMAELNKDQFDHETIQRAYIAKTGEAPKDTNLMTSLGLS